MGEATGWRDTSVDVRPVSLSYAATLSRTGAVDAGKILLLAHYQGMAEPMAGELDGYTLLHILGVGGVTALAIWLGYGVMWLAERAWEWWDGR